jgi:alkylhydroperoxidase family enzyme
VINALISRSERQLGAPLDYLRFIARTSFTAFVKFLSFMPLSSHRQSLPKPLWHAARIAATLEEDCGTCVQITVNQALQEGVSPALVQAVVKQQLAALPEDMQQIIRYAQAVTRRDDLFIAEMCPKLMAAYGEAALTDLALGIATARVYPSVKRALGMAVSCSQVEVKY